LLGYLQFSLNMKYLLVVSTTVLMALFNHETKAQSSTQSLENSPFLAVPDSIGKFEVIKSDKYEVGNFIADEGTNDPTSVGMTLEYWGTQEVYRKTTSVNGLHLVLIYIPKD